jgi:predicted permease
MLGIGATTAIYSLVDQVLLHALPVRQPERLVLIDWQGDQVGNGFGSWNLMSYPLCRDLDQQKQFFEGVFCRALTTVNLSVGSDSYPAAAEIISGSYFPVLGVGPALGEVLTNDDDHRPNANSVAVLSYGFWQSQFDGASDVVGRKVLVNGQPLTIIGVAAASFRGIDVGEVPALWIPASMSTAVVPGFNDLFDRRTYWMQVLGRLNPGVTLQNAQTGLQPWFKAILREDMARPGFPVITPERRQRFLSSSITLTSAPQGHSGLRRQLSEPLWTLLAVTAVLLGLVCLNVSGLFLARASTRTREIATRLALGASSGRIARQLLAESLLLAIGGGLLGIAAAPMAVRVLIAFIPQGTAP